MSESLSQFSSEGTPLERTGSFEGLFADLGSAPAAKAPLPLSRSAGRPIQ